MKKWLCLLLFLPLLLQAQQEPTSAYSTQGTFLSSEGDLWFIDKDSKWVAFGNAYFLNRPMLTVSNVSAMVTVPAWSGSLAKYVQTLGYYTPGDGGAGLYIQMAKGVTNMGRFASTNSAYMWQLIPDLAGIKLRQYGAKGDGVADDTQAFRDWLVDIDQKMGSVSPGVYAIRPTYLPANSIINIVGTSRFGVMTVFEAGGLYPNNTATFLRYPGSGVDSQSLITSATNSSANFYNVVLNGNKTGEPNATNAYLYEVNGGKVMEIDGCVFYNSAGHGLMLRAGAANQANWSVINNSRFYDLNRGVVMTNVIGGVIDRVKIQNCKGDVLSLVGYCSQNHFNNMLLSAGMKNGVVMTGAHNRFRDVDIANVFESCVLLDVRGVSSIDNSFFNCYFYGANVASSPMGTNPNAAGAFSVVQVLGSTSSDSCTRMRFEACFMGDSSGAIPNRSKYSFEWLVPLGGTYKPWQYWQFANNHYMWNANWIADYSPLLDYTQNVNEISCIHANNESYNNFGRAGHIGMGGWGIDVVLGGAASSTNKTAYMSDSHMFIRDTTAIGVPVLPTTLTAPWVPEEPKLPYTP